MNLNLSGRVALVTGSSSGLGKEIALTLAQAGAKVIICGRQKDRLMEVVEEFEVCRKVVTKQKLSPLMIWAVDASDAAAIRERFSHHRYWPEHTAGEEERSLDILVNNIGGAPKFGKFEDLTDEDWQNTFDLNVMSTVRFTREAIKFLQFSKHGGRIINIGSLPGIQPGQCNPNYAVAKAGVHILTKCLANEFGPHGIRTNCICPSTLYGGGLERNVEDMATREGIDVDEARRRILMSAAMKNPLNKVGSLTDVANLVVFLASDAAQFINGTCIPVDGGESRSI